MSDISEYIDVLDKLIDYSDASISDILPSVWAEENRIMTGELSSREGPYRFTNSPYIREILDCLSPSHPSRKIAIMKGAQIGLSTGLIENAIGWIIAENPGNILFLVGHDDLVTDAGKKVDALIDNTGIRNLIRSSSKRKRNSQTGDTNRVKEYPGGYLKIGTENKKTLRNISMKYGFIDDFEGMRGETKEAGSTTKMIEQRFASFAQVMKLFYISTPELKETSNIESVYELGDKRKYNIPCPCCGEFIVLEWSTVSEIKEGSPAGIYWELDNSGKLISESVGYVCQKCDGFFTDQNKNELLNMGEWIPTVEPSEPGYYSYHISALCAPTFMYGWERYVRDYLEAHDDAGNIDEAKMKTFYNLCLGQTWEGKKDSANAQKLQENIRDYEIGIIPGLLSDEDGNGEIVLITCGADLGGKTDDARLDYEIVAYSSTGASYSIEHGSIGTFVNSREDKNPEDRDKWTYRSGSNVNNSIWVEFDKLLNKRFTNDKTGKNWIISMTGLDTGHFSNYAYTYINNCSRPIIGLKGKGMNKHENPNRDVKLYVPSKNKKDLYLIETNRTKDNMVDKMNLRWNPDFAEKQPNGFMNFPTPNDKLYQLENYFSHFEAEEKRVDKNGNYIWVKKTSTTQNHLFDCRLYAEAVRQITVDKMGIELKEKDYSWDDYVEWFVTKVLNP